MFLRGLLFPIPSIDIEETPIHANTKADKRQGDEAQQNRIRNDGRSDRSHPTKHSGKNAANIRKERRKSKSSS